MDERDQLERGEYSQVMTPKEYDRQRAEIASLGPPSTDQLESSSGS
jgi:hypothetical protein